MLLVMSPLGPHRSEMPNVGNFGMGLANLSKSPIMPSRTAIIHHVLLAPRIRSWSPIITILGANPFSLHARHLWLLLFSNTANGAIASPTVSLSEVYRTSRVGTPSPLPQLDARRAAPGVGGKGDRWQKQCQRWIDRPVATTILHPVGSSSDTVNYPYIHTHMGRGPVG